MSRSRNPLITALEWHIDAGADEALQDMPNDRTAAARELLRPTQPSQTAILPPPSVVTGGELIGTAQACQDAAKLARACATLEELRAAIEGFDGLSIRKTATNLVFSDGNPNAHVMLVGEAPGADEDRQGKPFVGVSGMLLDKIFKSIGLSRDQEDPARALYISNILNWRPPGNRTPSPGEVAMSLPFIERHIALVRPRYLVFCGGVAAKALLGSGDSISRLRGKFHDYRPLTEGIDDKNVVLRSLATYHPSYLLRTPSQKKLVWADMLMLRREMEQSVSP